MNSEDRGAGLRKFWIEHNAGRTADVRALVREYPDEALALADAVRKTASRDEAAARERMWLARAKVLGRLGEDVSLGALLRESRLELRLSTADLSMRVRQRGAQLLPIAIEQIEAGRATITNIRTPGLWRAITEVLEIDRHQLVAAIRAVLFESQRTPRFTRMERGASTVDRESFLASATTPEIDDSRAQYLDAVRVELGLPSTATDSVQ